MNDWTASQIRDVIDVEIKAERRLRNALRQGDNQRVDDAIANLERKFDASVADVEKATKLLFTQNAEHFDKLNHAHEEAQRILATYAALRDFNELKSKVDLALADIATRLRGLDESTVGHHQRLRNIEEVQPPVAARLKDIETQGASREERLRGMEAADASRITLWTNEKERLTRTIQRFQIASGVAVLIGVVIAILNFWKTGG